VTCSHLPPSGHVTAIFALVSKIGVPETEHLSGPDDPRFAIGLNVEQEGEKVLCGLVTILRPIFIFLARRTSFALR